MLIDPIYFKIIEDLNSQSAWVPKRISLCIDADKYVSLLKGYQPHWDMRYGMIYQFEDGYFYAYRSGYVVGKYRFEKRGDQYVCVEMFDNPDKSDCLIIFEAVKEACDQNKVPFSWDDIGEMAKETYGWNEDICGCMGMEDMQPVTDVVVASDDSFTAQVRTHQSKWREWHQLSMGFGPTKGSAMKYGNMLEDGESSGRNFYFRETFEYAQWRVSTKLPVETIDAYRLFNNLMSSMPMAFNLFHPLMMLRNENPDSVDALVRRVFPDITQLHRVTEIGLEFIPTPIANYTGDKSAMDAFIRFQDKVGNDYLIAIEVKYTDRLGTNTASKTGFNRQLELVRELGLFTDEAVSRIENGYIPITQIYRNFLLAEQYGRVHGLKEVYSIILAPEKHPSTDEEIDSLQFCLRQEAWDKIGKVTLEDFIGALTGFGSERYWQWAEWMRKRYLVSCS